MAKRKLYNKLIKKDDIKEELYLVNGSVTDYITQSGNVYCAYGDGMFLRRAITLNKHNGYCYVNINYNGKIKQRRLHRLVAEIFIPNDDVQNKTVVMHIDNNKQNNCITNLKWGTISENTKQAYDDKLAINDKGFDDSQSLSIAIFDLDCNLIDKCGSVSLTSVKYGVTKSGILYQCYHKVKNKIGKPKCGFYFRFLNEYEKNGFVL